MYGQSFSDHVNPRKKRISVNFSANSIAHMLLILKKDVSKKLHIFHAVNRPANQEVNFDVISNVMTFLTLHVKV